MQEEVENRTVTLAINGTKFSAGLLKSAIAKFLAHRKEIPHGRQSVKQLIGQNQGVSSIEVSDSSMRDFDRVARKYGVDYAVRRDRSACPPKFLVFFKARDADAITAAFNEYAGDKLKNRRKSRGRVRPSVLRRLREFKDLVASTAEKVRNKVLER